VIDPISPSDRELVQAAGRGDAAAFEAIYARHRDWTYTLAQRFCGNRDEALDILQETFIHLARRCPSLDLSSKLRSYLYPVVMHLANDRRKRRRDVVMAELPEKTAAAPVDGGIDDLLKGLSESQRETVILRYVDGFDLEEIARAQGIPVGTVKSRLHESILILRRNPPNV
jgi:RNA polymerase sigma-70 factor (ECF subfamily)